MKKKTLSYDAKVYNLFNCLVIKKYKDAEQIRFLNEWLPQFYPNKPPRIMPVAWHEWSAIKLLYSHALAPFPIYCGKDFIIMTYVGKTLEGEVVIDNGLYLKAQKVLETLDSLGFKHNDLLPRNICINKNDIKLIDFTMAEFNGVSIINEMPNPNWAYPGDERLLSYFKKGE